MSRSAAEGSESRPPLPTDLSSSRLAVHSRTESLEPKSGGEPASLRQHRAQRKGSSSRAGCLSGTTGRQMGRLPAQLLRWSSDGPTTSTTTPLSGGADELQKAIANPPHGQTNSLVPAAIRQTRDRPSLVASRTSGTAAQFSPEYTIRLLCRAATRSIRTTVRFDPPHIKEHLF